MALTWKLKGRPALFKALENICDQIDDYGWNEPCPDCSMAEKQISDLKNDSLQTKRRLEAEVEALHERVASLTLALEGQIETAVMATTSLGTKTVLPPGSASLPADATQMSTRGESLIGSADGDQRSAQLEAIIAKMQNRHIIIKGQLEEVVAIARRRKQETLNWVAYADSLEKKLEKIEKRYSRSLPQLASESAAAVVEESATHVHAAARTTFCDNEQPKPTTVARREQHTSSTPDLPPPLPPAPPPQAQNSTSGGYSDWPIRTTGIYDSSSSACPDTYQGRAGQQSTDGNPQPDLPLAVRQDNSGYDTGFPTHHNGATVLNSTQSEPSTEGSSQPLPQLPTPSHTSTIEAPVEEPPLRNGTDDRRVTVKQEPSSDELEFVLERPVKRQRQAGGQPTRTPHTPSSTINSAAVKTELTQDSPIGLYDAIWPSQASLDLDEGQLALATPRKRLRTHAPSLRSSSLPDCCGEADDAVNGAESSETGRRIAPGRRSLTRQQQPRPEPPPEQQPEPEPQPQLQAAGNNPPSATMSGALAALSPNVKRPLRGGTVRSGEETSSGGDPLSLLPTSSRLRPLLSHEKLSRNVEALSEANEGLGSIVDGVGDPHAAQHGQVVLQTPVSGAGKPTSRLKSLLNTRPSEPSPVVSALRTQTRQRTYPVNSPVSGPFGLPPPVRNLAQIHNNGTPANKSSKQTPDRGGGGTVTPTAGALETPQPQDSSRKPAAGRTALSEALKVAMEEASASKRKASDDDGDATVALRDRPIDQLQVDDFKVNPAANAGASFAFNEVVRGRTERGNLDGCTDPQCCGRVFRSIAESELVAAGDGHTGRREAMLLMERFLGDGAYVLGHMSPDEKRDLWLEARTKQLADTYGKHRHRYHRRASPPGFWDADFPTTQEEVLLREEAKRVEKQLIQERHREAMRPGGRWLFRDE